MTNKQKKNKKIDSKKNNASSKQEQHQDDRYTANERAADFKKYEQLKDKK